MADEKHATFVKSNNCKPDDNVQESYVEVNNPSESTLSMDDWPNQSFADSTGGKSFLDEILFIIPIVFV